MNIIIIIDDDSSAALDGRENGGYPQHAESPNSGSSTAFGMTCHASFAMWEPHYSAKHPYSTR